MMLNKVIFVDRNSAEATEGLHNWAIISISEPDCSDGEAKLLEGWHAIHRVAFHDIERQLLEYQLITTTDAESIVKFVQAHAENVEGIIVHCRAGISRSAAVAKWIAHTYHLPFDHDYARFNRYVYNLLISIQAKYQQTHLGLNGPNVSMRFKKAVLMKHSMHNARDLPIDCEVDLTTSEVWINVDAIDTALLQMFLQKTLPSHIQEHIEVLGTKQPFQSIANFRVMITIASVTFDLKLVKRDFEPAEPTLVFTLIQ